MSKKVLVGFTLFCVLVLSNDTYAQRRRPTARPTLSAEEQRKYYCKQESDLRQLVSRQTVLLTVALERTDNLSVTPEELRTLRAGRIELINRINARSRFTNRPAYRVTIRTHLPVLQQDIDRLEQLCTVHTLSGSITSGLERSAAPLSENDPYSMPSNRTTNPNERPVSREGLTPARPAQD